MFSIVIIIPYFSGGGKFARSNDFWLKSVEKNTSVDFLMFTDKEISNYPQNMKVVKMPFTDLCERFQRMLDCDISNLHPYKLCDFKPAYGYLFQEYIKKYDFWGHCDNDLILGDIRHFLTDDILGKNDRLLTRGHFTLYRNNKEVNSVFKKAMPSYKEVFSSHLVYHFDEHPGTGKYWFEYLKEHLYDEIIFDDLNWKEFCFVDVHKSLTKDKNRQYFVYSYEDGKMFRCFWENGKVGREEIMYAHFQKRTMAVETVVSDFFTIVPNRFISYVPNIDYAFLRKNAHDKFTYKPLHFFYVKWNSLKRKIKLWRKRKFK